MANATATSLLTRVRNRAAVLANDTGLPDTRLIEIINEALQDLSIETDWPWLQKTQTLTASVGSRTIALAADWAFTRALVETGTGYPLTQRQPIELFEVVSNGRPVVYAIEGEALLLSPVPDSAYGYTHLYQKQEVTLVLPDVGLTIFTPPAFDSLVVEAASSKALRHLRQEDRAKAADNAYKLGLIRAKNHKHRSREPSRVRVRPGSMI